MIYYVAQMNKAHMDKIEEVLTRGVENIYPSKEKLEALLRSGKKIRLYQGFDPSMPNLHLGNLVGIMKLRQFQDLGCEVIFLVGDFTGMIGDPTDKSSARQLLTREQVLLNAKNWKKQAGRILRFTGENPVEILFNSDWSDKISFKDLIKITANFTVQQMLERDFFQRRLKEGKPIYFHEFLYPVAQAYDSVAMDVDLEVGGNDQTFNMLCGRILMAAMKGKEKFVLTTKLLIDSAGNKVGKTTGNALFLNATPTEMFGGVMAFPDEVIVLGFELLTLVSMEEIKKIKTELSSGAVNPMNCKKNLAFEIVKLNFGEKAAQKAQEEFEQTFQKNDLSSVEMPTMPLSSFNSGATITIALSEAKLVASRSEAKRLLGQGAIEKDSQVIKEDGIITLGIYKIGKRKFVKIIS